MWTLPNAQIQQSIPSQLNKLVSFIHGLHILLYCSYATAPNNVNDYLEGIHHQFWYGLNEMQQHVNAMSDIKLCNLEWVGSKDEACRWGKVAFLNFREYREIHIDILWPELASLCQAKQ